jgi:ATP-dependent DNA ligase
MLAKAVHLDDLDRYITDDAWSLSPKLDGHRKMLHIGAETVETWGRDGQRSDMPRPIVDLLRSSLGVGGYILDGELMPDGRFFVFDLASAGGVVNAKTPFATRHLALTHLFHLAGLDDSPMVRLLPVTRGGDAKRELVERVRSDCGEGIIARHDDGPYQPGKRSERLLKLKFTHELDVVVTRVGVDGKDNAAVGVYSSAGYVTEIGTVSNRARGAKVGEVWVIRCLYVHSRVNPRLVQPVLISRRTDKTAEECTLDQLETCYTEKLPAYLR